MDVARQPDAPDDHILYSAKVPANRPASDYTPRVIPCGLKGSVPLEAPHILWQH
jgi:starch phosphorylase